MSKSTNSILVDKRESGKVSKFESYNDLKVQSDKSQEEKDILESNSDQVNDKQEERTVEQVTLLI